MADRRDDSAQRDRALEPENSFIVQAPAGSGKTELLIRRFLVLLAKVEHPEQVVAITFTRKAAAEMRSRVVEALRAARGPRPSEPVASALWQLAQAATARDAQANWQLASHPSRLQIQTIDALCLGLVRRMPWLSGCGAPLAVVDDATELYRDAALQTVHLLGSRERAWSTAVARLLRHVDGQVGTLVVLLTEMLGHRDQWLRKTYAGDLQSQREILEANWRALIARYLQVARRCVSRHDVTALLECVNHAARNLSLQHEHHVLSEWGERSDLPGDDDLVAWQALCGFLFVKSKDALRRQVTKREGFTTSDAQMKQRMQELLVTLAADEGLLQALVQVRRLPPPEFAEEQWQVLDAINVLLPLAAARLQMLFGERGVADFTEINQRANAALGSVDEPTDLALKLDYRIQHLLVDEFQDTSFTQFQFLQLLTAGWQPGDGRTLFLVGDPKQSIYRFREAEVGFFQRVIEDGIGALRLQSLQLTDNFRSDPELVEWVNRVLPTAFPVAGEARQGAIPYAPSRTARSGDGTAGAFMHALLDDDSQEEAQRVVELIQECRRRRPRAEVAILVRSRSHLAHLLPALQAAGVPCAGVDTRSLAQQAAVTDVIALTRALLQTADRLAWLAILRAPWCGLMLNDLHAIAGGERTTSIWQRLNDPTVQQMLSVDARSRLARVLPILEHALRQRGRRDWRDLVEATWIAVGGPASIAANAATDVETYFRLLEQHQFNDAALNQLERLVANHWAAPEADPDTAVQVMTMHKAKGLQFDIVVLPSLHRKIRDSDDPLLRWEEDPELGLLLAPRKAKGGADNHHRFLGWLHKLKDHHENGRLLYVACTRARQELHLVAAVHRDPKGALLTPKQGLLPFIWPGVEAEFNKNLQTEQGELFGASGEIAPSVPGLRRIPANWQVPDWQQFSLPTEQELPLGGDESELIEFSWAGESARHAGVLVHEFLQLMADQGLAAWGLERLQSMRTHWQQELAARGLTGAVLSTASQRVEQALTRVLDDPRAQWLFGPDLQDRRSEYAVSVWRHGRVRSLQMDLTFVDAHGQRWIVDYKSSSHEGGDQDSFLDREVERYREQLHGYAEAMAHIEPRPIQLALYFPLLQAWREWPHR